jgi:hypothetical protein
MRAGEKRGGGGGEEAGRGAEGGGDSGIYAQGDRRSVPRWAG